MNRLIITIILSMIYLGGIRIGFCKGSDFAEHLFYPLCHANIFHLLCNLLAVWCIKWGRNIIPAYAIAVAASYIPPFLDIPTYGFSGVIIAAVAFLWGKYFAKIAMLSWIEINADVLIKNLKRFVIYIILPFTISAYVPSINFHVHLYSFVLAFMLSLIYHLWKQRGKS